MGYIKQTKQIAQVGHIEHMIKTNEQLDRKRATGTNKHKWETYDE